MAVRQLVDGVVVGYCCVSSGVVKTLAKAFSAGLIFSAEN